MNKITVLPVSAVIATIGRAESLARALDSLAQQNVIPLELIVVDSSHDGRTENIVQEWNRRLESRCSVIWQRANQTGAAVQRNQGVRLSTQSFIWFFDDDIVFGPNCVEKLWQAIQSDPALGGVNALIVNQHYTTPGTVSRLLFQTLNGKKEISYAGKCIGPALNLLPEDAPELPEVVPVEWLNTTCVIYRRSAIKIPPFADHFTGYSFMEDAALSLTVGKNWNLANARTARIFHDTQPGEHKSGAMKMAKMELVNRHYVMTSILSRNHMTDYLKLALLEVFGVITPLVSSSAWKGLLPTVAGKLYGLWSIATSRQIIDPNKRVDAKNQRLAIKGE